RARACRRGDRMTRRSPRAGGSSQERPRLAGKEPGAYRATTMFVHFRETPYGLAMSLVENRRENGRICPIGGKWLELIRDTAPGAMRVLVIFEPDIPAQLAYLQAIESAAPTFRVELIRAGVRNAAEIERAIDAFAQEPKGALIVVPSALGISHRDLI